MLNHRQNLNPARQWMVIAILTVAAVSFGTFAYAAPKAQIDSTVQVQNAVNLNKASLEDLQSIRGVGPALADRILQYRQEHGRFEKVEDLVNVRGIGQAKFEKMKSQISI